MARLSGKDGPALAPMSEFTFLKRALTVTSTSAILVGIGRPAYC